MRLLVAAVLVSFALAAGCAGGVEDGARELPEVGPEGKTDVFGRRLAGVAAPYPASILDEDLLQTDARARREAAWATAAKLLEPVPLLGLADSPGAGMVVLPSGEVPMVPRFETWYGIDDVRRMFQHLYEGLGPAQRAVHAPFPESALEEAVRWNATSLDRMNSWPLERYLKYVRQLGQCPEELSDDACVALVQQQTAGAVGGNARILYSPAAALHVLRHYGPVLDCLGGLDALPLTATPESEANFTRCFEAELPHDAVVVKAQWLRADFGKKVPAWDTDGASLAQRLGGAGSWGEDGDRQVDPSPRDIYTIKLRSGDTYRLVGLHIMTKELRHWQWLTLWWSDRPGEDFGADRPEAIRALEPVWSSYKMCVAAGYLERDDDPAARFADLPALADAVRATHGRAGAPTWCSNPYLEHGRGNARTNCIGCHQHGGATVAADRDGDGAPDPLDLVAIITDETFFPDTGRRQIREVFPADYLFSFNRVDDWAHVMAHEVDFFAGADKDAVRTRVTRILGLAPDADAMAGGATFAERCAGCHGDDGTGTTRAPSLFERVPMREPEALVQTLLSGRGGMPAWGDRLDDVQLARLYAFLRATFGGE